MDDSGIEAMRPDVQVAMLELHKLAGMIKQYDPALYVCIEDTNVEVGARAIAHFYDVTWASDVDVFAFCRAVRAEIIERHGLHGRAM